MNDEQCIYAQFSNSSCCGCGFVLFVIRLPHSTLIELLSDKSTHTRSTAPTRRTFLLRRMLEVHLYECCPALVQASSHTGFHLTCHKSQFIVSAGVSVPTDNQAALIKSFGENGSLVFPSDGALLKIHHLMLCLETVRSSSPAPMLLLLQTSCTQSLIALACNMIRSVSES